jgi:diguanylate cyclase (GGDEF)-like protein
MTSVVELEKEREKVPLFILSFRHRDELANAAAQAGWQAIAARRAENVEQRFLACGAMIAVVDARGSLEDGLAAVHALSDAIEINAAAMLVLVSRNDVASLDAMIEAGATHYLASPFKEAEFLQSVRFAERHAVRLAGGWHAVERQRAVDQEALLSWTSALSSGTVRVSDALRKRIGLSSSDMTLTQLFKNLGGSASETALQRLIETRLPTAHSLEISDGTGAPARAAQHMRLTADGTTAFGTIELLDAEEGATLAGGRDPLTGLRNAVAARGWIDGRITGSTEQFHVLLVSITRFEMINTAFGRETGDDLLQTLARQITPLVRDIGGRNALVARTAGAEFIIGLDTHITQERALILAEAIADAAQRPLMSGTHLVTLSARVSVIERAESDRDATQLLRRASSILADAKASEGGPIRVVGRAQAGEAMHDASLASDLRAALDRDEIEMLFQPQVSITTNKIVGVEALARWQHPVHGVLGAATLFTVAEGSDYLLALSQHIQRRAVKQAAAWPATLGSLRMAVNITSSDIGRPGFAESFLVMIDESGFPRDRLTVEVTESGLIDDLNAAATLLAALRAGGCRVAIDDFGTGYSSLAYLKALPLDYLKIDKKLAEDITGSTRDRIVVRGVIDMARSLGLAVIAEGVETEEQLSLLAREGCNYYQGFLCGEPLDVDALEALVSKWPN